MRISQAQIQALAEETRKHAYNQTYTLIELNDGGTPIEGYDILLYDDSIGKVRVITRAGRKRLDIKE